MSSKTKATNKKSSTNSRPAWVQILEDAKNLSFKPRLSSSSSSSSSNSLKLKNAPLIFDVRNLKKNETSFVSVYQKKLEQTKKTQKSFSPLEKEILQIIDSLLEEWHFKKTFQNVLATKFEFSPLKVKNWIQKRFTPKKELKELTKYVWMTCSFLEFLVDLNSEVAFLLDGPFRLTTQCFIQKTIEHLSSLNVRLLLKDNIDLELQNNLVLFSLDYCSSIQNSIEFIRFLDEFGVVDFPSLSRANVVQSFNNNLLSSEANCLNLPDHDLIPTLQEMLDQLVPIPEDEEFHPDFYFQNSVQLRIRHLAVKFREIEQKMEFITKSYQNKDYISLKDFIDQGFVNEVNNNDSENEEEKDELELLSGEESSQALMKMLSQVQSLNLSESKSQEMTVDEEDEEEEEDDGEESNQVNVQLEEEEKQEQEEEEEELYHSEVQSSSNDNSPLSRSIEFSK